MSESLSGLLVVKPWPTEPVIHRCHDALAHEMAGLVDTLSLSWLLWIYRTSSLLEAGEVSFRSLVDNAIETLLSDHGRDQCKCTWGKTNDDLWVRFEPGILREYYSVMCPNKCAAEELRTEWVQALPDGVRSRERALIGYQQGIELLVDRGLGHVMGTLRDKWQKVPLVRLHCSPDALQLMDTILMALAKAHIDEVTHWTAAIRAGTSPHLRDCFPSSVFLVRNHRGIDSLLVWPAGSSRSFEDEATKSWKLGFESRRVALAGF